MKYLHTMVRVTDVEASLKFYRDALGLQVVRQSEHEAIHPDLSGRAGR